jgi:hypothetical protein
MEEGFNGEGNRREIRLDQPENGRGRREKDSETALNRYETLGFYETPSRQSTTLNPPITAALHRALYPVLF